LKGKIKKYQKVLLPKKGGKRREREREEREGKEKEEREGGEKRRREKTPLCSLLLKKIILPAIDFNLTNFLRMLYRRVLAP
jgi:hypothetical protein